MTFLRRAGWVLGARTYRRCTSLCTATNKKLVTFFFWTATKTNYISKWSDFQKKLIDTITTSNFYLNSKKTMKMTWLHKFFGLFFFPADGRARSAKQLISTVLPFHPLYFPWVDVKNSDLQHTNISNNQNCKNNKRLEFMWHWLSCRLAYKSTFVCTVEVLGWNRALVWTPSLLEMSRLKESYFMKLKTRKRQWV